MPLFLSTLAGCYAELGKFDDAWHHIVEAAGRIKTSKETWCEAEVNRIAGKIALKSPQPDVAKAEGYFERFSRCLRVNNKPNPGKSARSRAEQIGGNDGCGSPGRSRNLGRASARSRSYLVGRAGRVLAAIGLRPTGRRGQASRIPDRRDFGRLPKNRDRGCRGGEHVARALSVGARGGPTSQQGRERDDARWIFTPGATNTGYRISLTCWMRRGRSTNLKSSMRSLGLLSWLLISRCTKRSAAGGNFTRKFRP